MTDTRVTLTLPYERPPLTPNMRIHWTTRAALTREIRQTTHILAKAERLSPRGSQGVAITIHWHTPDRRRRDVGCLTLTAKAAIDGLVDAGILTDDDHTHVTEERYRISHDPTNPRIELWIEDQ
ncbi:hypothetical protein GCM10027169_12960 [Gordonia jinhuaensis]|uniref:RusA-like resolvase n=1 Tax=Gordonia jinhuaensis TaxID=1517702 RepID=A0A916WQ94_9ACTN|nr:hypothetical protein GCM10011489_08300 [Gordonia jinhuaensis]